LVLVIAVTIAGGLGTLARYAISNHFHGEALPWATVAINVAGSFLLGILVVLPASWISGQTREALGVGLLGGFTTFSTFSARHSSTPRPGSPARRCYMPPPR
jgi:fluoride exporter